MSESSVTMTGMDQLTRAVEDLPRLVTLALRGVAWQSRAWQGGSRHGAAWLGKARRGLARQGPGVAWRGAAWPGSAWRGMAVHGPAWRGSNEAVMLLELIPDMPEMLDDAKRWAPKPYKQHFRDSGFMAKDLV